ncbi:hypothetical protein [Vibrio sp. K4]|uniref:hypothetical protein n=1 Tax=Vibrio sp. K4 TaxID=3391579 RepID=UPI003DA74C5B
MATLEQSLALLDDYLSEYTADSLLDELQSYKGLGPKVSDYLEGYDDIYLNTLGYIVEDIPLYSLEKSYNSIQSRAISCFHEKISVSDDYQENYLAANSLFSSMKTHLLDDTACNDENYSVNNNDPEYYINAA